MAPGQTVEEQAATVEIVPLVSIGAAARVVIARGQFRSGLIAGMASYFYRKCLLNCGAFCTATRALEMSKIKWRVQGFQAVTPKTWTLTENSRALDMYQGCDLGRCG